jgi:hypothetical protein
MAGGSTYQAIATTTLGSAAASYTFSSIPSIYTDLILVLSVDGGGNIRVGNGSVDSGTNYSDTSLFADGTSAGSLRRTGRDHFDDMIQRFSTIHFQNYSNTTTYKTVLARQNNAGAEIDAVVGLWRSTSAINTIYIYAGGANFAAGSTFTIYGIKAA